MYFHALIQLSGAIEETRSMLSVWLMLRASLCERKWGSVRALLAPPPPPPSNRAPQ